MYFLMYTKVMKFAVLAVAVIASVLVFSAPKAEAQFTGCDEESSVGACITSIKNGIATPGGLANDATPSEVLARVIRWMLTMVALLAMVAIVWGGMMYILSLGNDQKVETAKKIILYAIIGLIVVIISLVIITTVQTFLIGSIFEPAIPIAHAQEEFGGLNTGIDIIESDIATADSGIAPGDTDFFDVLDKIIVWLLGFIAVVAVAVVIWAGFMYILALGDQDKAQKAKRILLYAVVGLILVGSSFLIIQTVGFLFIEGT